VILLIVALEFIRLPSAPFIGKWAVIKAVCSRTYIIELMLTRLDAFSIRTKAVGIEGLGPWREFIGSPKGPYRKLRSRRIVVSHLQVRAGRI
jgi:hypothetical protein